MNKIKLFWFVIIFFFLQSFSAEKYVIGARRGAGFFSSFFHVLMHLIGCNKNNLIPVVYWDYHSPYYVASDDQYNNVWEYYFEPLSNLHYSKNDKIHRNFKYKGTPYIYAKMPKYTINFNYHFRKYMNDIIEKYIIIKEHILNKIELFFENNMNGEKIIGMHVRGTNKIEESFPINVDVFLKIASKYADNGYKIFIASDEYIIVEKFKKTFPGKVIFYDAHRSSNSSPHYLERDKKDPLTAIIGEEVLIETILLSKCDLFVHSVSNVSTAVLFFNPKLKHIFIDYSYAKMNKVFG